MKYRNFSPETDLLSGGQDLISSKSRIQDRLGMTQSALMSNNEASVLSP
jgi:hypothetical protein